MSTISHIVVPTDFSESCKPAIDAAAELALKFGASITLVHVWQLSPYTTTGMEYPMPDFVTELEEAARAELLAEERRLRERVPTVATELRCGAIWEEILDVAKRRRADLIVMGTHGRSGLKRAILGSVAEKIVRSSPIPVLTVRPTEPRATESASSAGAHA